MRVTCRAIIFKNNEILLIYREKAGLEPYYVFPGGGVEEGEIFEECVIRECKEELGIDVLPANYVYEVIAENASSIHHFFVCKYLTGTIGTGNPEEYDAARTKGLQVPMFVPIAKFKDMNIISPAIVAQILSDYAQNGEALRETKITINDN